MNDRYSRTRLRTGRAGATDPQGAKAVPPATPAVSQPEQEFLLRPDPGLDRGDRDGAAPGGTGAPPTRSPR